MTTLDLDALEKLAREATQGDWYVEPNTDGDGIGGVWSKDADGNQRIVETDDGFYPPFRKDADYIAVLSPPTVLELLRLARIGREVEGQK